MNAPVYEAYLQGALHDGTRSRIHKTHRISQKGTDWLGLLQAILRAIGHKSWVYREGKTRDVYVLETCAEFLDIDYDPDRLTTIGERLAYVRGYFDAEGGLPRSSRVRFYIQFSQKDRQELDKVKAILESQGIACGDTHNPSCRMDAGYWRFYVRARSHAEFARRVGAWHPRKARLLRELLPQRCLLEDRPIVAVQ
jgi:intein-encoded DNA endonuclease-like protein